MAEEVKILAVDDNPDALYALERMLAHNGFSVVTAETAEIAYEASLAHQPALILLDVVLPGMSGYELTEKLKAHPEMRFTPVILVSANDALENVTEGIERGADDYITKPYQPEELLARLKAALRTKALYGELKASYKDNAELVQELASGRKIIGDSAVMKKMYTLVDKVADSDSSVLISGPTGAGKELVARAIHLASPRQLKRFVAQNCAALNENLLESALFGHKKGAFTGAVRDQKGLFEVADKGTLFLDEIGEMPTSLQAKLLRVLQEGSFMPLGSTTEKTVDARVVAATNRDLLRMIDEGTFREDLYFRLNVVTVELPALKERPDDIPLLVEHFLERSHERRGTKVKTISAEVLALFQAYDWRGNVRELENEIERMLILGRDEQVLTLDLVSDRIKQAVDGREIGPGQSVAPSGKTLKGAVEAIEREVIRKALERCRWNKSMTAKELEVSRSSLISKIKHYELEGSDEEQD